MCKSENFDCSSGYQRGGSAIVESNDSKVSTKKSSPALNDVAADIERRIIQWETNRRYRTIKEL